ncbi:ABC transporter substrate-binding protein [Streptomyces sodiiphilus]|uniref:ABC transporter substrate-binding protein n=1 Tax=Streptomyces sodiiphilus TaxID=226217 RepID=A0ABP5APD8_9ACTN
MIRQRKSTTAAVATATALALALTACSSKAEETGKGDGGGGDEGGIATDIGVTDDTITLGSLTDMTGPYATLGASITQAQQLYVKETNEAGGICDRQLKLEVRDHGYEAEKAISAYTELEPSVLAFVQFIGSPYVTAVKERIDEQDEVVVLPQAWSASLLGSKYIHMIGTTYDYETINAIDFLMTEKGIEEGDTIGHIYFEGDYGENALEGSRHAAEEAGLTVVEQMIKPTDEDMTAQVGALGRAGASAIIVSAGPRQAASVAGVAAAGGLNVPIIGNNSAFAPQLLATDVGPALMNEFYIAIPALPIGSEEDGPQALSETYSAEYPDAVLDSGVVAGYNAISLFGEALQVACDNEDLTREGIADAMLSQESVDNGFGIVHNFSDPEAPSSLESFITKPDDSVPGGTVVVREAFASDMTGSFSRE